MALFDQAFRRGTVAQSPLVSPIPKTTIPDLLAIAEDYWVDDLCNLSWAFYDHLNGLFGKEIILNPTFDGSNDVGGADADMIVDGSLIELKATIHPKVKSDWLYQLLGYTLLDYTNRYHIGGVALYMARQQVTLQWSLDELMTTMAGGDTPPLEQVRAEFHDVASEYRKRLRAEG